MSKAVILNRKKRWLFRISPPTLWLENLSRELNSLVFSVVDASDDNGRQLFWSSTHLESCQTAEEATARALSLKALFDGALYLFGEVSPLKWDDGLAGQEVSRFSGTRLEYGWDQAANKVFSIDDQFSSVAPFDPDLEKEAPSVPPSAPGSDGALLKLSRAELVQLCGAVASHRDVSQGILRFLGTKGINWVSLYAVSELISEQYDIKALADVSKAKIGLFNRTANSYNALGPDSRHGDRRIQPPGAPMPLSEAYALIAQAIRAYFIAEATKIRNSLAIQDP